MIDLIIKTNGSERHLSLPIDEQSVPGITEKIRSLRSWSSTNPSR